MEFRNHYCGFYNLKIAILYLCQSKFLIFWYRTQRESQERIVSNFKKCLSLQDTFAESKKAHEAQSTKIEKLGAKISTLGTNFQSKMQEIEANYEKVEKLKTRIRDAIEFERDR